MMRRALIALAALALCGFAQPLPEGFTAEGTDGDMSHAKSGYYFPHALLDFQSGNELVHVLKSDDVVVGYNYFSPTPQSSKPVPVVTATVSVYSRASHSYPDDLNDEDIHQREIKAIDSFHHHTMQELHTSGVSAQCGREGVEGMHDSFRVQTNAETARFPQSELFLFIHKNWIIKFRFTSEADYTQHIHEFVQAFFKENAHKPMCN